MPSPSAQRPWTPALALLQPLARPWPTLCLVCRRWQAHGLCQACVRSWAAPRPRCTRCAIDLPASAAPRPGDGVQTCRACEDASPEFDRAITGVDYSGPWPGLIARLKFHGQTSVARELAQLLAAALARHGATADLIVPVPLSAARLRSRGYNQTWLLAKALSVRLGLPARHDVLRRLHDTRRLMALSAEERQAEIQDAFVAQADGTGRPSAVSGRHVALVDDVMTTGATLNAAAAALFEAGAASVSAWVVARTPAPRDDPSAAEAPARGREGLNGLSAGDPAGRARSR